MDLTNMLRFRMMGESGGYRPANELSSLLMEHPSMMMGRLGVETPYDLRGGASLQLIRLPDGSVVRALPNFDIGMARRLFGGDVDLGLQYGPNDQYRAMLQYRRQF